MSGKPSSTIGFERRFNKAFQPDDREAFVQFMLENIPESPPRAEEVRALNSGLSEREFHLTSKTAIVSFIVSFGVVRALCNLFATRISEAWGRRVGAWPGG